MESYKIMIADDHALIRQGIKSIIRQGEGLEVIGEAADGEALLELLKHNTPEMLILDISMPKLNGLEVLDLIHESHPELKVLILTMHGNSQYFFHAISAGAHGYLLKDESDTELLPAIETVRKNQTYVSPHLASEVTNQMTSAYRDKKEIPVIQLTLREKQVLRLVVKGQTSKQMAEVLCLSPRTVDHHRARLLKKFKMKNTVDLVNYVLQNSIVMPE